MIPRSWKHKVRAPRGKILVDRDPVQSIRHGLYVPESYLDHTKTATGVVVDIHGDTDDYGIGDQVLLSVTGGVQLVFGLGGLEGETELWMFDQKAVKLVFEETVEQVEESPESILRHERHRLASLPTDDKKWVEGDREGLR